MNSKIQTAIERAKLRAAEINKVALAAKETLQQELVGNKLMTIPNLAQLGWQYDTSVAWNEQQMQGINAGLAGKSFCLIGAAGTGKTTTQKGIIYSMLKNNLIPIVGAGESTKWISAGTPGVVICSFTNMAVRQSAKHFSRDVTCITIHKLLEYQPVYYDAINDKGEMVKKMVFEPSRHRGNPLPNSLKVILIDEASMVDTELFNRLWEALPNPWAVQFIIFGDLNQLPPVYGGPILGKKLLEYPIIELTQVYRQALLSPIIRYALRMKDGLATPVSAKVNEDDGEHGRVVIHPWSKRLKWEDALLLAQNFCKGALKEGAYDPMQDMILCPYNVKFGVIELNLSIADYLGRQRGAEVIEVIAGFNKHYLAAGDKVLVSKQEAIITSITPNSRYIGKRPLDVKKWKIDRFGGTTKRDANGQAAPMDFEDIDFDVDAILDAMQVDTEEGRKTLASHTIKVRFLTDHSRTGGLENDDDGDDFDHTVDSSSGVNDMLFAYAITVHKSQGSEWRRVFLITHHMHAAMCSRELMYTAMTRAKNYLYIICEPDRAGIQGTLSSAARKPRLKGDTLAEKLVSLKESFEREAREAEKAKAKNAVVQRNEEDDEVLENE